MALIFTKAAAFTCCMCSSLVLSMRTKTSAKLSYFVSPYNFDCLILQMWFCDFSLVKLLFGITGLCATINYKSRSQIFSSSCVY